MAIKRSLKKVYLFITEYIFYNIFGAIRVLSSEKNSNYKMLKDLRNRHFGERCFIVATGPSLRIEDVEKLENEITFSLNSIFMIFDKTKWRSTYYLCMDELHLENVLRQYGDEFDKVCKEYKFFNSNSQKTIASSKNMITKALFLPVSRVNRLDYVPGMRRDRFYYRKDPVMGIYNSGTITNSAIILAMYMGFKTIYLLGTDCNYKTKVRHIGKDWNDDVWTESQIDLIELRMRNGFREIADIAEKEGVKIYNATRGGMLEDFERVDFDTIDFGRKE